jgi:hypothetical protein
MARSIIQLEATHGHPAGRYRTPSGATSIVALPRQPFLQTQNASIKFLCPPLRGGLGENLQSGSKNLLNQQALTVRVAIEPVLPDGSGYRWM